MVFSCSVLNMGVEGCNWALCKTPNCLIINKNYVEFQSFGGGTYKLLNRSVLKGRLKQFTVLWVSCYYWRPNLSAIDISVLPLWIPFFFLITFVLSDWFLNSNFGSQGSPDDVEQQTAHLHFLCLPRLFSSNWTATWYCPVSCLERQP